MRVEAYSQQIEKIIEACPVIQLSNVTYEKRGTHEGFIRGELCFVDGSTFYLREFVDVEITPGRLMYADQFIDSSHYPHHKHDGVETRVIPSAAPDLATVLQEVESLIQFL